AGFLILQILAENMVARRGVPAGFEVRPQAAPMRERQRLGGEQIENRRSYVDRFGEVVDHASTDPAGEAQDERYAQRRIVAAMLLEAPVLAEAVAVVRHVDNQRVALKLQATQRIEHDADVAVEKAHRSVIGGDDPALFRIAEVAENERDLPGVFRADAGPLEVGWVEPVAILEREIEGRVRLVETDPERKGVVLVFLQEAAALGGDECAGHIAFVAPERQLLRVKPDARRILERLPAGLDLYARWRGIGLHLRGVGLDGI